MRTVKSPDKQLGKYLLSILLIISFSVFLGNTVLADDANDNEESFYANPAQAQHAAQLADEAALSNEEVQDAWDDFQNALDALGEDPTEEELAAVEALEDAYQDKLAEATGVIGDDIEAMREAGMGWGDIAHELGVHPSVLGLGHKKGKKGFSDQEIAEATARNTKSGSAKGHGLGLSAGVDSSGKGLGKNSGKGIGSAKGGNVSGASGLGKGKGNSASGNAGGKGNSGGGKGNSGGGKGNSGGGKGNSGGDKGNSGGGKGNSGGDKGNSGGDKGNSGGGKGNSGGKGK